MTLRATLRRWSTVLVTTVWVGLPPAQAMPPAGVQVEVDLLLGYIEHSGCEFQRNGSWSDAHAAQAHLHDKYAYLSARDMIDSTEHFIERAATRSSLTGQAYWVRCNGGTPMASQQWLREELARLRGAQ